MNMIFNPVYLLRVLFLFGFRAQGIFIMHKFDHLSVKFDMLKVKHVLSGYQLFNHISKFNLPTPLKKIASQGDRYADFLFFGYCEFFSLS